MAWDDEFEDDYLLDEEDELVLIEADLDGEYLSEGMRYELDYEQYEDEKDEGAYDDFPESFEEWRLMKEQEKWEYEQSGIDQELLEYEE